MGAVGLVLAAGMAVWVTSCARPESRSGPEAGSGSLRRLVVVEDGAALGVGRTMDLPESARLDGGRLDPASLLGEGRARVLVVSMTSATCPVSKDYAARLAAMEREFASRGVAWVYVNAVDAETIQDMRDQVREYGFAAPYLPDTGHAVARALGARTTTEVYVFGAGLHVGGGPEARPAGSAAAMTLLYRGGVDDQYGIGTTAGKPTREFLRDAIEAALAGRAPEVEATYAPGCLVDLAGTGHAVRDDLTYHGRIAGILANSCTACHVAGGPGPFPLTGIEDLRGRASMIAAVVRDGLMPPTHGLRLAADAPNPWRLPHTLSQQDRDDLLAWLGSGMAIGPMPVEVTATPGTENPGWTIGSPEQVLMTPMLRMAREGPLQRSRSLVPLAGDADLWLTAIEFKPVKQGSVQRAYVWLLTPGGVLPDPERMPESGASDGLEFVGTYSPGIEKVLYRSGSARRLPAGSALVVEMVSKPMGRDMGASLRIGLKALPAESTGPEREVRTFAARPGSPAEIPSGARITAITPVTSDADGSVRIDVVPARGVSQVLIDAERIDPRWVVRYELVEPLGLAAGGSIGVSPGPVVPGAVRARYPEPEGMGTTAWVEVEQPRGDR